MKWVLIVVGGLAALVGLMALIGALLPREHVATSAVTIHRPPQTVWSVVRDLGGLATWWPEMRKAERLPDRDGREVWRQEMKGFAATLVVEESQPPRRMVTRIDSPPGAPFGGSWTYVIEAAGGGSTVTVTEQGWIANPIFRFMSRFVFGYYGSLDGYLKNLGRKFGETVTPIHS